MAAPAPAPPPAAAASRSCVAGWLAPASAMVAWARDGWSAAAPPLALEPEALAPAAESPESAGTLAELGAGGLVVDTPDRPPADVAFVPAPAVVEVRSAPRASPAGDARCPVAAAARDPEGGVPAAVPALPIAPPAVWPAVWDCLAAGGVWAAGFSAPAAGAPNSAAVAAGCGPDGPEGAVEDGDGVAVEDDVDGEGAAEDVVAVEAGGDEDEEAPRR
jgi:hypothetical protein